MSAIDLLVVGARGGTNAGESLYEGAKEKGMRVAFLDARLAWEGPWLLKKLSWHLRGHRPLRLQQFGRQVVRECARLRPRYLLSVGIAPIAAGTLRRVRELGVHTLNFLTDDPWNPTHRAPWALRALREHARVISPRRANLRDLAALGCPDVRYVPFGYDPRHWFHDSADPSLRSDVIFVGGADADRVPWVHALAKTDLQLALYGNYWGRFRQTRGLSRGQVGPVVVRRATSVAKVAVCIVRHANRDGHVMRSLEIPAIGTCMAAEDTPEHRALFGREGECVTYFKHPDEMVEQVKWLVASSADRQRLAAAAEARIKGGNHTYGDRIEEMLREGIVQDADGKV